MCQSMPQKETKGTKVPTQDQTGVELPPSQPLVEDGPDISGSQIATVARLRFLGAFCWRPQE